MEKAIEIKRRAQRCIQNGDLDGALSEYEKLVTAEDSDPYNFVLLADLLFKRGDTQEAVERYLSAATAYERAGLFKNAIAVCKKMTRLSLSPGLVLERLGHLHALDGLNGEATMYYTQFAEHLLRDDRAAEAAVALRKAFDASPEEVRVLERLAEVYTVAGEKEASARTLAEAADRHRRAGRTDVALRCSERAEQMIPGSATQFDAGIEPGLNGSPAGSFSAGDLNDEDGRTPGPPLLPSIASQVEDRQDLEEVPGIAPGMPTLETDEEFERFPSRSSAAAATGPPALPIAEENGPGGPAGEAERASEDDGESGRSARERARKSGLLSAHEIEGLLAEAQERFRAGDREGAARLLLDAAQAYDAVGRLDNAASIYRSLFRGPDAPSNLMDLWFANCEQRGDRRESAQVACEIGDRALQDGRMDEARGWFERAKSLDQANSLAQRRLTRIEELASGRSPEVRMPMAMPEATVEEPRVPEPPRRDPEPAPSPAPAVAGPPPAGPGSPVTESDRVEMAVGRGEAVTFDLGALLSEFQRGIEAQLSGDAQSHYDLAMTYREMGLVDQALESFRIAAGDPLFAERTTEMIGRCLLDQGRFDEAIQELAAALGSGGLSRDSDLGLRYQLGLALEAAGRFTEALEAFEQVFAAQSSYADVAQKLRTLRKAMENA